MLLCIQIVIAQVFALCLYLGLKQKIQLLFDNIKEKDQQLLLLIEMFKKQTDQLEILIERAKKDKEQILKNQNQIIKLEDAVYYILCQFFSRSVNESRILQ
jgi:hypothetical protein